jgi:hypothetical protein
LVSTDKKLQPQPSITTQQCEQDSALIFKEIDGRRIVQEFDLNSALNVSRKSS